MIDCLIVDDEAPARQHFTRLLSSHHDVRILGEATNGLDALEQITAHALAVVFLDIEMPGATGFDVARQLPGAPVVVFVTAYDQYAVQAFEANAIDYVLKPVTAQRLAYTMNKVRRTLREPSENYQEALQAALARVQPIPISKLAATRGRRIVLLSPQDVLYLVANDKLVFACTATERLIVNRTIEQLETLLSSQEFVRTSRSVLMNLSHARELSPSSSGTWKVRLSNGEEIGVSRLRARQLRARIS